LNKIILSHYKQVVNELATTFGYDSDIDKCNFADTATRATKALSEIILNKKAVAKLCNSQLVTTFKHNYTGMVVVGKFRTVSMCPHHLLPISYDVVIGYIPDDVVLGLSKIIRFGTIFAKQPILQEDYTDGMAKKLMSILHPKGVGIHVTGVHGCMFCRGVLSDAKTVTMSVDGNFLSDIKVKQEFLIHIKGL